MKTNKKFISMLAVLSAIVCCGCGGGGMSSSSTSSSSGGEVIKTEEEWSVDGGYAYYHYTQLGRDVMPIGAWVAPPSPWGSFKTNQITRENYRILSESGLNSIYALYDNYSNTPQLILNALDYCEEFNLVYMVRDNRMLAAGQEPDLMELFEAYQSKPAYGGNLVVDEPGVDLFDELGALKNVWNSALSTQNKLMYVNMLPSYASTNQLINGAGGGSVGGEVSYAEYLRRYIQQVHPQMLSFDFYPFHGHDENEFLAGYYQQLHDVKKITQEAGIPFWTFTQAGYFHEPPVRTMPQGEFMWQVNTALAYGAKGIQYFCYWSPLEFKHDGCAFITRDGQKTYLYDYGVKMNKQIKAIDHVLMKSANLGIIQVGNTPDPIPEEDKLLSFRQLVSASGSDAIIGCFDYRGKTALYVASNNYRTGGNVTLRFANAVNMQIIQDGVTTNQNSGEITLSLSAGEGVLVVLN